MKQTLLKNIILNKYIILIVGLNSGAKHLFIRSLYDNKYNLQ